MPAPANIPKRKVILVIGLLGLLLAGGLLYWTYQRPPVASPASQTAGNRPETAAKEATSTLAIVESQRPPNIAGAAVIRGTDGRAVQLPPAGRLRDAIDPASSLSYNARLKILQELQRELTPEEVNVLLDFVRRREPLPELRPSQQLALKNGMLNLLQRQPAHAATVMTLLSELAQDPDLPAIERDYALQHLASMAEDQTASTQSQAHWEMVEHGPAPLAAAAMLHLLADERLGEGLDPADRARLSTAALHLVNTSEDPVPRATALSICGRLGVEAVREPALRIATSDSQSFPLRIAAVAVLGDLTPAEPTLTLLRQLEAGREKRLRLPATSALKRLNAHQS